MREDGTMPEMTPPHALKEKYMLIKKTACCQLATHRGCVISSYQKESKPCDPCGSAQCISGNHQKKEIKAFWPKVCMWLWWAEFVIVYVCVRVRACVWVCVCVVVYFLNEIQILHANCVVHTLKKSMCCIIIWYLAVIQGNNWHSKTTTMPSLL